jgi:hypothetical protein
MILQPSQEGPPYTSLGQRTRVAGEPGAEGCKPDLWTANEPFVVLRELTK